MNKIASLLIIILIGIAVGADAAKQRKFYLTKTEVTGKQALTACADSYHMASLWEIFDPSNLRYDTTLGLTNDDSGFGPPVGILVGQDAVGWIRTGFASSGTSGSGRANCFAWTSESENDRGSIVLLGDDWTGILSSTILPWRGAEASCESLFSVWCVEN